MGNSQSPNPQIPMWGYAVSLIPAIFFAVLITALTAGGGVALYLAAGGGRTPEPSRPSARGGGTDSPGAARKTFTREEIFDMWNYRKIGSAEDLQKAFGRPDKTREEHKQGRVSGYTINGKGQAVPLSGPVNAAAPTWTVTIYEYNRLSVDAKGSGKVDSRTVFYIGEDIQPEFVP